ncbi:MAG TPA: epoxide hydrolase [Acidimicrobiales bacterium]|nr:epoxide hydrolase [Acidimicrobiales bacterium]
MPAQRRAPQPFPVAVEDDVLDDLFDRVRRTRYTDAVPGAGWTHGTSIDYLRELAGYWADGFDWRAQERWLNQQLPGWVVDIEGRRVHYARCPGMGPDPLPLVLLHGWPGSFVEMVKVAPLLADPARYGGDPADAFEVIVPSLPGHGFSAAALRPGFGADQCADVIHALMTDVLGLPRFGAQGGDRGAFVCAGLGHRHGDAIAGIHLNLATGIPGTAGEMTDDEHRWLGAQQAWIAEEGGYMAIQGTRPQTLGFALNDSPVGLAAWIVEKWRAWSDCRGDIESVFTKSELLTNVTLYWVTETIRSSMHYYYEHRQHPPVAVGPERIDVPTGVAMFPAEVMRVPREAVARKYDLRRWTEMDAGGHFAAMEQPGALVADIREFFRPLRSG